jgi:hypothetical protein
VNINQAAQNKSAEPGTPMPSPAGVDNNRQASRLHTESEKASDFLANANDIIARGLSIIPVKPHSKAPLIGALSRSNKPDVIATWAEVYPDANVGIVSDENFTILETDDLAKLREDVRAETGRELPETLSCGSGRPNHCAFIFRRTKACGDDCLEVPGVFEFRNRNQYVVGPGSVHPNGSIYRWMNDVPIVEMPDWLMSTLKDQDDQFAGRSGREGVKTSSFLPLKFAYMYNGNPEEMFGLKDVRFAENERHYSLLSTAGFLHDGERSAEEIADLLKRVRDEYCVDPGGKSDEEVGRMAEYACKRDPFVFDPINLPKQYVLGTTVFTDETEYKKELGRVRSGFLAPEVEGPDDAYIIGGDSGHEGWFPRGDVSLIGGYSGAGKSTFGLDMLEKQARGEKFYGRETYQLPYHVVLADRSRRGLRRTMKRMHIDLDSLPHSKFNSIGDIASTVERVIVNTKPMPAAVFIEGIDLLGDSTKSVDVATLLRSLSRLAEHYFVAIIGSTGSPKVKGKDGYKSAREMFIGSGAWGRLVETMILIQREKETDDLTTMTVLPRQTKAIEYKLRFKDGRLVEVPKEELARMIESEVASDFAAWVLQQETFTSKQLCAAFPKMNGQQRSRKLDGLQKGGAVKRHQDGRSVWYEVLSDEIRWKSVDRNEPLAP